MRCRLERRNTLEPAGNCGVCITSITDIMLLLIDYIDKRTKRQKETGKAKTYKQRITGAHEKKYEQIRKRKEQSERKGKYSVAKNGIKAENDSNKAKIFDDTPFQRSDVKTTKFRKFDVTIKSRPLAIWREFVRLNTSSFVDMHIFLENVCIVLVTAKRRNSKVLRRNERLMTLVICIATTPRSWRSLSTCKRACQRRRCFKVQYF